MDKEQLEKLKKIGVEIQEKVEKLAKENGVDSGNSAHMDGVQKDEFEKMKTDLIEMQKKLAESKKPAEKEIEEKTLKGFTNWLLKCKYHDPEVTSQHLKTVMSEGTPAQGGYTVPYGYSNVIIGLLNDLPVLVNRMTPLFHTQADGFTKYLPKWLTDLTVYWVAEASVKTSSKPTLTRLSSVLKKMAAVITFTDEYLADDNTGIANQVAMLVAENFAMELERVALVGDVSGAGDPFNGVYYAVTAAAQKVDQAAANLSYTDFVNAYTAASVIQRYKTGAEWFMNQAAFGLVLKLVDGQNRPLWNMNSALSDQPNGNILGRKINLSDTITSVLGDNSDHTAIMYGDPKYIVHGKKTGDTGISVLVSQEGIISSSTSVTENLFTQDETGYRFVQRDSIVVVPDAWYIINEVR